MNTPRILIGSPIHQKPDILDEFLTSLQELEQHSFAVDYLFIDDNENTASSQRLQQFANEHPNTLIIPQNQVETYMCDEEKHHWDEQLIWKVARFKNEIIRIALETGYDYLFFVDSDLILHPLTIERLKAAGQDIVSTIFWTAFQIGGPLLPQVWMSDQYRLFYKLRDEDLTPSEEEHRKELFLSQLKVPGLYEVGGLGACTLLSRHALERGVNFSEIKNLEYTGEDRHFCIRAAALGFSLYVDTHFPAYHIYRESDLTGISAYKEQNKTRTQDYQHFLMGRALAHGIERLGTFHYKTGYAGNWVPYFTESYAALLLQHIEATLAETMAKRSQVKGTVSDVAVQSLQEDTGLAHLTFTLTNDGIENDKSFYDQYRCSAEMTRDEQGYWRIATFTVLEKTTPLQMPLVRFAKDRQNKLTLSMVVKNEADRYLRRVLAEHRHYIDEAVIIDDGSTDGSAELCLELLHGIPVSLVRNEQSKFHTEHELRSQQWQETLKTNPDWILNLDADEMFERQFRSQVRSLIDQSDIDVYLFRLYDFWNEEQYRNDEYWQAHLHYRPFLVRYQPNLSYEWQKTAQHSGRFPRNILELPKANSPLRLKHFGWATPEDRQHKYNRYLQLDPNGQYGWKEQYQSILDPAPHLVRFVETD